MTTFLLVLLDTALGSPSPLLDGNFFFKKIYYYLWLGLFIVDVYLFNMQVSVVFLESNCVCLPRKQRKTIENNICFWVVVMQWHSYIIYRHGKILKNYFMVYIIIKSFKDSAYKIGVDRSSKYLSSTPVVVCLKL